MDFSLSQPNISWKLAWQNKFFRRKVYTGLVLLVITFTCLPFFFQYIQHRPGTFINDCVLAAIPVHNVSVPIFAFIWAVVLLAIIRARKQPMFFLLGMYAYFLLCAFRYVTLFLVPLEPPAGLIALTDPISNAFYGKSFITKDLFFSGHTSTVFLLCFCMQQKKDRYFALAASILVGGLLLVQHVHYTIDVLSAPFFSFLCVTIARRWTVLKAGKAVD